MRIQKGILLTAIIAVALVFAFTSGCTGTDTETDNEISEIHMGYQPSTHQLAYMTAMKKGWWQADLAPYGVEKVTESEFPTGAPEMAAMISGKLDVAYVGAAPVISAIANGLDARIVSAVQVQGSNLVLRSDLPYESPEDLRGLTIATFPPGTIQDTLLRTWLSENGLEPGKDIEISDMGPGDAITALEAGSVDAAFLPHPAPSVIEVDGKGRSVVASGEMQKNHACCVLVVSGDLIRNHPDLVEQIVKTHIKATEYNLVNQDEAAEIFSEKTKWDVETVKKSLNDWDGSWISDPNTIVGSVMDYTEVQADLGYIPQPLAQDEIFDLSFYGKATA